MADENKSKDVLVHADHVKVYFKGKDKKSGTVRAVDDISFDIFAGETFGVVGESGCGKSTTGRTILRLIEPTSGEVIFDGEDVCKKNKNELRLLRRDMQLIFQDPYASLDPRKTVSEIIAEPLKLQKLITDPKARMDRVRELMQVVGLADRLINTYPHELDGGRRQRIGIARALTVRPKLIIADEPTTALDVTVQLQVLRLLKHKARASGTSVLFISHDMAVVSQLCDRMYVMYAGSVIESGTTQTLIHQPVHPYSIGLLQCAPENGQPRAPLPAIPGTVPNLSHLPQGCAFRERCFAAGAKCSETPRLAPTGAEGQQAACWYPQREKAHV